MKTESATRSLVLLLIASAAAPSRAALVVPITALNISLSPILITAPEPLVSPAFQRLDVRARELLSLGLGMGVAPLVAGDFISALAAAPSPQADRLIAGAMARLIEEPSLGPELVERRPELAHAAFLRLPSAMLAADPYRGTGSRRERAAIAEVAAAARGERAVSALFDGGAVKVSVPYARLSGSAFSVGPRRAREHGPTRGGRLYVHPQAPDATIEVFARAYGQLTRPEEMVPENEPLFSAVAARGHAPATLGRDDLFVNDISAQEPMRAVVVRERVTGKTAAQLIEWGGWGPEARGLVREALLAVARAGGDVLHLRPVDVVVGSTALRPERRGYVVDVHALRPAAVSTGPDAVDPVETWLAHADLAAAIALHRATMRIRGL